MDIEVKKLLLDILNSVDLIEGYLTGIPGLADYKADAKTIDAVERRLAISGEALWKADKMDGLLAITDKKKIIALRHILVHDYDLAEDETVWTICKKYLPVLRSEIREILKEA